MLLGCCNFIKKNSAISLMSWVGLVVCEMKFLNYMEAGRCGISLEHQFSFSCYLIALFSSGSCVYLTYFVS